VNDNLNWLRDLPPHYGAQPVETTDLARMTPQTRMVLRELVASELPSYGREIAMRLDLSPATVQRTLDRLKDAGWVVEVDSTLVERRMGDARPRQFFELTPEGKERAQEALRPRGYDRPTPTTRAERTKARGRSAGDDFGLL
jgi:DNA-binding MarR family transcriptional regulator